MRVSRITYTPSGEVNPVAIDFRYRGFSKLSGGTEGQGALHVSRSGVAYRQLWDTFQRFDVELNALRPTSAPDLFEALSAWWSHCLAGGEFAFALDADQAASTTLASSAAQGAVALAVVSGAGIAGGDWVWIEQTPAKFQKARVRSVASNTVTLYEPLPRGYASGSIVRHAEYWPTCVVLDAADPLVERDAERGANVWDLRFSFRTVR
jgi:hypothetical protein